jgi:hypothetical protein
VLALSSADRKRGEPRLDRTAAICKLQRSR